MGIIALVLSLVVAVAPSYQPAPNRGKAVYPVATISSKFGTVRTPSGYVIQNNAYNAEVPQTLTYYGGTKWAVTKSVDNVPTDGMPAAYPSIYAGDHWGNVSNGWQSPKVSDIDGLAVSWYTTQTIEGTWDVSLDLWFNSAPDAPGQPDTTEIMVWLNHRGPVQPYGELVASAGGAQVWHGKAPWDVVTYDYSSLGLQSWNTSLLPLMDDAMKRGYLPSSAYLTSVEAGFEIWQGGTGLTTSSFGVSLK